MLSIFLDNEKQWTDSPYPIIENRTTVWYMFTALVTQNSGSYPCTDHTSYLKVSFIQNRSVDNMMEWFINHNAGGYPRVITGTYYYDIVWYRHLTGLLSTNVSLHTDNGDIWGCLQTIVRLPKIEQHWCSPHFWPTRAWFHNHRAGIQFINIFSVTIQM